MRGSASSESTTKKDTPPHGAPAPAPAGDDDYEDVYVNVVFPPNPSSFEAATDPIDTQATAQQRGPSNEIQESINYKNESGVSTTVNKLRVSGWAKANPLFQSKSSVLLGEWSKLVGTEMVFDENGKYLVTVDDHIALQHGRLLPMRVENRSLLERAKDLAAQVSAAPGDAEPQH